MAGEYQVRDGSYEYAYPNYSQFKYNIGSIATYHVGDANVSWVDGHVTRENYNSLVPADFDRRTQR